MDRSVQVAFKLGKLQGNLTGATPQQLCTRPAVQLARANLKWIEKAVVPAPRDTTNNKMHQQNYIDAVSTDQVSSANDSHGRFRRAQILVIAQASRLLRTPQGKWHTVGKHIHHRLCRWCLARKDSLRTTASKTVCPGKQDMCEYRAQGRQHKLMAGYCSSPKGGKFRISATLGEGAGPASRNSTARALSR